jgi:hypothetical protein
MSGHLAVSMFLQNVHIYQHHCTVPQPRKTQTQSQSYLTTDSQLASLSWCQATIRAHYQFFLELKFLLLRVRYFVAPTLTRGQVCNLLLLLVLAGAVQLESVSRGTQDHILLSQFLRLPQPGGPGPHIYNPQREREFGVVVRDTTIEEGVGNNNFRFEGSQALPASPSDKGEG